jgi:hypothetical protein
MSYSITWFGAPQVRFRYREAERLGGFNIDD